MTHFQQVKTDTTFTDYTGRVYPNVRFVYFIVTGMIVTEAEIEVI